MPDTRLEMRQTQKLSQSLQTAIHLLSLDLESLSEEMHKAVAENPALEYVPPQRSAHDYAVQVKTHYSNARRGAELSADFPAHEDITLQELEQQLHLCGQPENVLRAAEHILHQLTPRGYFAQDLREFAQECGIPYEVARQALDAVQSLDPPGVGARSLEECLELQLRERGDVEPLCYDLVRMYLLEISKGNLKAIARATGASLAYVRRCVDTVRGLNPIPCSLRQETVRYIMPEFSVESGAEDELTIVFHNDYYPTLRQDDTFRRLAQTLPEDGSEYARKALASASQFIHAIEMRQTTMEKIARIIVREQRAFFLGMCSLAPYSIAEAAREMDVHETTVYRAIQGKYLYCARGTYPLNHFFPREVSGGASAAAAKEMILALCREKGRLSDREIAEELARRGVTLSRRTVAKYRSQMDIDSSFRRRADEKE